MADNPTWFDEDYYLKSKLNQLQLTEPDANWNMASLIKAIADAGFTPLSHFTAYSAQERTSPNPFFNAHEYLEAKLRQLQETEPGKYSTIGEVAAAIEQAGMNLWDHFQAYGWQEGVNPSNSFDINGYFENKLEELQRQDPGGEWDLQKVKDAFAGAGLDPISHYESYGQDEGVAPAQVPEENRVPSDPNPVEPTPEPGPGPGPEPGPGPGPGPAPTFIATNTTGTVAFSGQASGEISLSVTPGNSVQFARQSVTAEPDGGLGLANLKRIKLEDNSAFAINGVNMAFPQDGLDGGATGGSPRFWLDYADGVNSAIIKLNGVVDRAALGVTGASIAELTISGSFAGTAVDGWHQLQLWDGQGATTQLPGLNKLILQMQSNTDLAAYPPLGVLTQPTELDGSGSSGGLKITTTKAPNVSWTTVRTGSGDDILEFNAPASGELLVIDAGAGNDIIQFGVDTKVTGGAGDDTFIITAPAGSGQPTKQLFITDYGNGNDIIDLTKVADLKLNGAAHTLEIHQGGKTGGAWGNTPQGTQDDILVQLSGGSGSQLVVENAHINQTTLTFKVTEAQVGFGSPSNEIKYFLANITEGGVIDARSYGDGALLSGGGGSQTLIGGAGNDILQGGRGADTFTGGGGDDIFIIATDAVSETAADVVLDFKHVGNDQLAFKLGADAIQYSEASGAVGDFAAAHAAANSALGELTGSYRVNAQQVGNDLWVFADTQGNGSANAVVKLTGVTLDKFDSNDLFQMGPA